MNFIKSISLAEIDICNNALSFLQSAMWGEFKSRFGWTAKSFLIDWAEQGAGSLLVLYRRFAKGFSFAYIPWGPELPEDYPKENRAQALAEIANQLKPFLPRNTAFIRFDLPWQDYDANFLSAAGFKQGTPVQAPDTVIIDLTKSCEDILGAMKPKWRYNIGLAEKKGVQVEEGSAEELEKFYSLLNETAARDGIAVHSFEYYKTLFEICGKQNFGGDGSKLRLYTAVHEGDTLAAIIVLFRGKQATYLYGASSNNKRNLMAPYALQWKAMQDAKEMGCEYYDLFGIPPNEDPAHPMAGLYRFKTGFGGQILHRPGCWDFPCKKAIYIIFRIAETFRKKILDQKKRK
ncbi:MAG: peptidoglycan bridge formation glycyltransferase FemA/FemB family protein [Treponema sp.]|jgi:lipid II:glycine glycyltransferase (peptidoglycan interpeptide bridge formation enzyme)|nr:peptidoglycan bridge formation glycyltransferase FemA/FemB family protein [Treponema sp.]